MDEYVPMVTPSINTMVKSRITAPPTTRRAPRTASVVPDVSTVRGSVSLIERFTRLDPETLVYEYTVTDPATWVSPWTAQVPMRKNPDPLYEYACHEGNYSLAVILRGARLEEKAAEETARQR